MADPRLSPMHHCSCMSRAPPHQPEGEIGSRQPLHPLPLGGCGLVCGHAYSTANTDGRRKKVDGKCPNFWAYYEVDREERIHSLTLSAYGQGGKGSWVLLEPVA